MCSNSVMTNIKKFKLSYIDDRQQGHCAILLLYSVQISTTWKWEEAVCGLALISITWQSTVTLFCFGAWVCHIRKISKSLLWVTDPAMLSLLISHYSATFPELLRCSYLQICLHASLPTCPSNTCFCYCMHAKRCTVYAYMHGRGRGGAAGRIHLQNKFPGWAKPYLYISIGFSEKEDKGTASKLNLKPYFKSRKGAYQHRLTRNLNS